MARAYVSPLRDQQAEATRLSIVEAVARVLARGVVELSVPAVAKEAGVSVATVYRHFPSKSDLVRGLAEHVGRFQGTGPNVDFRSLDEMEAIWLEVLRRRARLDPALRQATSSPEWNRLRAETRGDRLAAAARGLKPFLAHLSPRDRKRARDVVVLLMSSAGANAYELLVGGSPEEAAATLAWAARRIIGEPGDSKA